MSFFAHFLKMMSTFNRELLERVRNLEIRLQIMEQVAKSQSKTIRQGSMMLLIMVKILCSFLARVRAYFSKF